MGMIKTQITSEVPPEPNSPRTVPQERQTIYGLVDSLVINGRWGIIEGSTNEKEANAYRAAAIAHGKKTGAERGFKITTVLEKKDGRFIIWVRKVSA